MMKQLLVPTDFSHCASNAVDFAVQSAKLLPGEVLLLHTYELSGNLYTDYMGVNKEFNESMVRDAYEKLMKCKAGIMKKEGVDVKAVFYRGTLKDGIDETVANEKTDLIVMGTTGASGLDEKIWGSKTAGIIGHSKIPVLAIPKGYNWKRPERVLIATNHFEKDPAMLDFVFEMAGQYKAGVHTIVFSDTDDDLPEKMINHGNQISVYEKLLKAKYPKLSLHTENLFGIEFEESIEKYASENDMDMLVMFTYHRSYWDRIFHPSITKRMSYHTHIPLLAIPAVRK